MTPCTATTVPIALRLACQLSSCATTVVTASGGGTKDEPCAMATWIWRYLTKAIDAITATRMATVMNILLAMISSTPSGADGASSSAA